MHSFFNIIIFIYGTATDCPRGVADVAATVRSPIEAPSSTPPPPCAHAALSHSRGRDFGQPSELLAAEIADSLGHLFITFKLFSVLRKNLPEQGSAFGEQACQPVIIDFQNFTFALSARLVCMSAIIRSQMTFITDYKPHRIHLQMHI